MLHIGIYIYCTNIKEMHKSYVCFQHANTRSGGIFGRVCTLKANTGRVSLLFVQYRYIFQYVTQNSTFTRQIMLSFIILKLIPMYTLVLEAHVCIKVI